MTIDTRTFLDALGGDGAEFTFQTFDDSPAKRKQLARILHGTLDQQAQQLAALNDAGAGIFVTVNQTDGAGREARNVTRVRALFVDLDGAPLQPVLDGPVAPHIVVESSAGRWHAYWLVDGCTLAQFRPAQKSLIARFQGDKAVHDLPRVMRLPGMYHRKGEPFLTRIAQFNELPRYRFADLAEAFGFEAPPQPPRVGSRPAPPAERSDDLRDKVDDLRNALSFIGADEYEVWIRLGMALKAFGPEGRALWLEWSAKSPKFDGKIADQKWESFKPSDTGHEAVFAEAKRSGWDPRSAPSCKRRQARQAQRPPPLGSAVPPELTPPDEPGEPEFTPPPIGEAEPPPPNGDAAFDFSLEALQQRYVLIYGTVTAYDRMRRAIIGLDALRAAATKKRVDAWLSNPMRQTVNTEDVIFDPTSAPDLPGKINLFRGLSMVPAKGDCSLIMELLHHLCDESENVVEWVLKWAAYPLQHVGAKMRTAIVMHGPEGGGKNIFWGAVKRIYGEYGVIIGQNELESRFNGWASAKLFVIGNEVVPRQELYALKGRVKGMITEEEWQIEEKHLPGRTEANHANFVFLSNVLQPVVPDPEDRRYTVIWTPPKKERDFYMRLAKQMAAGGYEAFYQALLDIPLGDFDEYSLPIETQAKQELIQLSMDTPLRFFEQWSRGELIYPFVPARTMHAYRAYRLWCERRGERPLTEIRFSSQIGKRMSVGKKYYINVAGARAKASFAIPLTHKFAEGKSQEAQLGESASFFRQQFPEDKDD